MIYYLLLPVFSLFLLTIQITIFDILFFGKAGLEISLILVIYAGFYQCSKTPLGSTKAIQVAQLRAQKEAERIKAETKSEKSIEEIIDESVIPQVRNNVGFSLDFFPLPLKLPVGLLRAWLSWQKIAWKKTCWRSRRKLVGSRRKMRNG